MTEDGTKEWFADRARNVAQHIREERQTGWFQRAEDWEWFAYEIENPTVHSVGPEIYGR